MGQKYDVAIVGARIAGASLALRLARDGFKVAMIDQAKKGSDTLSTHFLWPRALSYLTRLGVIDAATQGIELQSKIQYSLDGLELSGTIPLADIQQRLKTVHGDAAGATNSYACIRRTVLDRVLVDEAENAGVEFFESSKLIGLDQNDGAIESLVLQRPKETIKIGASFFVAADGRSSTLAKLLSVPTVEERPACTSSVWSYYSGIPAQTVLLAKDGRYGLGAASTNNGLSMLLVWGPRAEARSFLTLDDRGFGAMVEKICPQYFAAHFSKARREERFSRAINLHAIKRRSFSRNLLLVGDAACFKDQCTASGILHALRDGELASSVLRRSLLDSGQQDGLFREYAENRERDMDAFFDFACQQAEMQSATESDYEFMKCLQKDQTLADSFFAVASDTLGMTGFQNRIYEKRRIQDVA